VFLAYAGEKEKPPLALQREFDELLLTGQKEGVIGLDR